MERQISTDFDAARDSEKEVLRADVTILGAGPGGCTAGILLAQAGLSVVIVEKSLFPRFRIGESLLPNGNHLLRRIGVWDAMHEAGFLKKHGAEFTVADGTTRVRNEFRKGLIPDCGYAFQVERAKFDQLLMERAEAAGCRIFQETRANAAEQDEDGWRIDAVRADGGAFEIRSGWVLDASGRESFLAKQLRIGCESLPYPKRVAIYRHFHGVPLQEGEWAGNIIITRLRGGWVWDIPLSENLTSLGVVVTLEEYQAAGCTPEEFFNQTLGRSTHLQELTRYAEPAGEVHVTTDYSFMHEEFAGPRFLLAGDAAGFMDPIFSSGVYLSMESAARAADLIMEAQHANRALTEIEMRRYTGGLKKSIRTMRDLIEMFYEDSSFAVFLHPTDTLQLAPAVNAVVAGNTSLPFSVWWRFQLFLLICRLNRHIPLVPYDFPDESIPSPHAPAVAS